MPQGSPYHIPFLPNTCLIVSFYKCTLVQRQMCSWRRKDSLNQPSVRWRSLSPSALGVAFRGGTSPSGQARELPQASELPSLLFPLAVGLSIQTVVIITVSSRSLPSGHESWRVCSPVFSVSWKFLYVKCRFSLLRPDSCFASPFSATMTGINHTKEKNHRPKHTLFVGRRRPQSKHMVQGSVSPRLCGRAPLPLGQTGSAPQYVGSPCWEHKQQLERRRCILKLP